MARRRGKSGPNLCRVAGCGAVIPEWKRLCDPHWRELPRADRRAIGAAMSERAPHRVASLALAAAARLSERSAARAAETARRLGEREDG